MIFNQRFYFQCSLHKLAMNKKKHESKFMPSHCRAYTFFSTLLHFLVSALIIEKNAPKTLRVCLCVALALCPLKTAMPANYMQLLLPSCWATISCLSHRFTKPRVFLVCDDILNLRKKFLRISICNLHLSRICSK